jgi:hypothetical protein
VGAALGRVYAAVAGNARAAAGAFAIWAVTAVLVVLSLAFLRERLGPVLSTDAARYYTVATVAGSEIGSEEWLPRWRSGSVLGAEVSLAVVLAACHAIIGFTLGRKRVRAVAAGVVTTVALLVIHGQIFRLFLIDYDNFHGDIFSGGLLFDLLFPIVASDPYSSIGTFVYVPAVLSSLLFRKTLSERGGRVDDRAVPPVVAV